MDFWVIKMNDLLMRREKGEDMAFNVLPPTFHLDNKKSYK
jgi:hypothetical protein